jgi:RNA polymerase sigma-70 factor (ECF subfamily)
MHDPSTPVNIVGTSREPGHATEAGFQETQWTQILHRVQQASPEAPEALERLCQVYWPPLYAYLRRQGHSPQDAQDLTQGFFVRLLAKDRLQKVDRRQGKFRSFLLVCLNNYVHNEHDKAVAEKRGGGRLPVPINVIDAEMQYGPEPAEDPDPSRFFERRWASTLIGQVLDQVERSCAAKGGRELFQALRPFLTGEVERGAYAQAAATLHKSEGAVQVGVSRLREEFREAMRAEVARTVGGPDEVDDEIRYLLSLFAAP